MQLPPGIRDLSGTQLGVYTLREPLGVGEGTVVWLGEGAGRQVAIRIDERDGAEDAEVRFARIRQLDHPRLMKVHGAGRTLDGLPYFVCELSDGQPLSELLSGGQPMPLDRAVPIALQLLDALDHAHRSGVLHLSPEPSGVFLDRLDQVKLRPIHGGDRAPLAALLATVTPQLSRKRLHYMAPERIASGRGGPPADVYAVGAMLFHMLTGRTPFEAPTGPALAREHLLSAVPS
ncbi:MAG: serine/threonine protein kinase, partial [Myxococcales bacterium]|nr:serine/threonine protein kinase [Myxococcales bacterium]